MFLKSRTESLLEISPAPISCVACTSLASIKDDLLPSPVAATVVGNATAVGAATAVGTATEMTMSKANSNATAARWVLAALQHLHFFPADCLAVCLAVFPADSFPFPAFSFPPMHLVTWGFLSSPVSGSFFALFPFTVFLSQFWLLAKLLPGRHRFKDDIFCHLSVVNTVVDHCPFLFLCWFSLFYDIIVFDTPTGITFLTKA